MFTLFGSACLVVQLFGGLSKLGVRKQEDTKGFSYISR